MLTSFRDFKHITSIEQFTREDMELLFQRAKQFELDPLDHLDRKFEKKILGSVFLEPSTRTRLSFESAMHRLGGRILQIPEYDKLSLVKGESESDSIRTISLYVDVLVARCPDSDTLKRLCEYSTVPIINGGDGANEHPTQALLDLYSIYREKNVIDGLKIIVAGDLKWARVAHSIMKGLSLFDVEVVLVSPPELRAPQDLLEQCKSGVARFYEEVDLKPAILDADVLYIFMLQRHRVKVGEELAEISLRYPKVNSKLVNSCKESLTILHPMVRGEELEVDVDHLPQAAYFRQIKNGVFLRMALLSSVLL